MLLLSYLSPFISPDQVWLLSLFALSYPILLLINLFLALVWMAYNYKWTMVIFVVVLLGFSHLTGFINWSNAEKGNDEGITVMSYNVRYLDELYKYTKAEWPGRVAEFAGDISQDRPKILVLQEASEFNLSDLNKHLKYAHTHQINYKGVMILSDFPIIKKGQLDFGVITNSCLWADLLLDNDTIRVYGLHLQSNVVSAHAKSVVKEGDLKDKETWSRIGKMFGNFRKAVGKRSIQAELVSEHIRNCNHPIILCGDLNDTPFSYTYRRFYNHLEDAFRKKGRGIGSTYAGDIPGLRIDYIFFSKDFEIHKFETLQGWVNSDHFPVKAKLEFSH